MDNIIRYAVGIICFLAAIVCAFKTYEAFIRIREFKNKNKQV